MNFLWRKHKSNNNNLQNRIQNLQNFQQGILSNKNESPILQQMRDTRRVKRISSVFEKQIVAISSAEDKRVNWWLGGSQKTEDEPAQLEQQESERKTLLNNEKIKAIIQHEREHIQLLEEMLQKFDQIATKAGGYVPNLIREQQCNLSGNLEKILALHKQKIWPCMLETNTMKLVCSLGSLVDNDFFYCYVTHVMLYSVNQTWLENYKFVIDQICSGSNFLLDCSHLKIYDILHKYFNWITEIVNELMANPRENADDIASCMDAEKKLDELLNLISEAAKIAYIKEVSRNNIEAIQKIYTILEKRQSINKPMLILVPRHSAKFGHRNPLDLLQLGKFVRIWTEKSVEPTYSTCFYDTNLFIFETCVIYTVIANSRHFLYNGHFWIKDCIFEEEKEKPGTCAILSSTKRQMRVSHPKLVSLLMQLKAEHKFDKTPEIEISQSEHAKILKKIEIGVFRRLSMASVSQEN